MRQNETANGSGVGCPDVDVLPPDENMMPTGHAVPIMRWQRKEVVWGVVGFAAGVGLTLLILRLCSRGLK